MNEILTLDCKICKNRKPIGDFYKSPNYKTGYRTSCKDCTLKYDRERQNKHIGQKLTGTKICCGCKIEQPVSEFTKRLRNKDGLRSRCKTCEHKSEHNYRIRNPTGRYISRLRQDYGLDKDTYLDMLLQQEYKCKICGNKNKLCIDHCHKTGKIRGILCVRCNTGIGMFIENIIFLEKAIEYLKYHE